MSQRPAHLSVYRECQGDYPCVMLLMKGQALQSL